MTGSNMNAGLDAGPVYLGACRFGAGTGFRRNFDTSIPEPLDTPFFCGGLLPLKFRLPIIYLGTNFFPETV